MDTLRWGATMALSFQTLTFPYDPNILEGNKNNKYQTNKLTQIKLMQVIRYDSWNSLLSSTRQHVINVWFFYSTCLSVYFPTYAPKPSHLVGILRLREQKLSSGKYRSCTRHYPHVCVKYYKKQDLTNPNPTHLQIVQVSDSQVYRKYRK